VCVYLIRQKRRVTNGRDGGSGGDHGLLGGEVAGLVHALLGDDGLGRRRLLVVGGGAGSEVVVHDAPAVALLHAATDELHWLELLPGERRLVAAPAALLSARRQRQRHVRALVGHIALRCLSTAQQTSRENSKLILQMRRPSSTYPICHG
jgi:hypothetical protein